jgi:hypothetical protein
MRLSQGGRGFDATIEDVNRQLCGLVLLAAVAASGCADSTAVTAPTTVALASIVLSSTTVSGGTPVTGVLTLTTAAPTGGAVITLASSSAAATVPASVTIPAGTNTFSFAITTTAVAASTTITATYATASQAATLTTTVVTAPALQSVFLSAGVSIAGVPVQGTITLTAPAPTGGLTVALTSSSPLATVPPTVVIPSGNTFQTFPIDIGASPTTSAATITATYAGVARAAALTIGQLALSIGPTSVPGGLPITGTVSLPTPAPDTGALVSLVSSSPDAIVPASVMIPAGSRPRLGVLGHRGPAELGAPDDQGVLQQPARLQVLEQSGDGPVDAPGLGDVVGHLAVRVPVVGCAGVDQLQRNAVGDGVRAFIRESQPALCWIISIRNHD